IDESGEPYVTGSTLVAINEGIQDLIVIFRVNYPNGFPGNKPTQEVTSGDNEIFVQATAGEVPGPPEVGTACGDMSNIEDTNDIVVSGEWRNFNEITSGKVLKWQARTYCSSRCPSQLTINLWHRSSDNINIGGKESRV
ncbi:MAG: hypothetical protein ACRC76_11355, partial [Proteocatella sp.]